MRRQGSLVIVAFELTRSEHMHAHLTVFNALKLIQNSGLATCLRNSTHAIIEVELRRMRYSREMLHITDDSNNRLGTIYQAFDRKDAPQKTYANKCALFAH